MMASELAHVSARKPQGNPFSTRPLKMAVAKLKPSVSSDRSKFMGARSKIAAVSA
jgi:hypothetical protein